MLCTPHRLRVSSSCNEIIDRLLQALQFQCQLVESRLEFCHPTVQPIHLSYCRVALLLCAGNGLVAPALLLCFTGGLLQKPIDQLLEELLDLAEGVTSDLTGERGEQGTLQQPTLIPEHGDHSLCAVRALRLMSLHLELYPISRACSQKCPRCRYCSKCLRYCAELEEGRAGRLGVSLEGLHRTLVPCHLCGKAEAHTLLGKAYGGGRGFAFDSVGDDPNC
mmetsp:Transcript_11748/g.26214  ORF Transcript_11748/g.26214 Transcript_11748/m.26214 type:complete len:221 (-) Transcript_11748:1120-1782(-)